MFHSRCFTTEPTFQLAEIEDVHPYADLPLLSWPEEDATAS